VLEVTGGRLPIVTLTPPLDAAELVLVTQTILCQHIIIIIIIIILCGRPGHITGLARLSVRPSVHVSVAYVLLTRKQECVEIPILV